MSPLASTFRSAHADGEPVSRSTWVRALAMAALAPIVTGLLATSALLTLILAIATSSHFSTGAVLSATGPVWLAAYQVPLEIDGLPLGVLPLLPTLLVCVLIARAASGAAQRLGCSTPDRAPLLIGVVAGAHAVVGGVAALLVGDAFITVDLLTALFVPALVSGLAAAAGVAKPCGLTTAVRRYLDPLAVAGLRAGALGLAGLVAAGGVTLLLATALSTSTIAALFAELAPGAGSATGLWLLSLGYVPNAVVLAMGFATGPGMQFGGVEVGPLSFTGGEVPPFPLLGALPDEQALWWPALMLLPAAVGAGIGWWLRTCHEDPVARLRTVGVAGALVGFGTVLAGFLSGGQLAAGPFDPVGIPLGFVSIAAFLWIAVPGALVAWFAGPRPTSASEADADGEEADEADADETDADVDGDADGDEADADGDATADEDADTDETGDPVDPDADPDDETDLDDADTDDADTGVEDADEDTGVEDADADGAGDTTGRAAADAAAAEPVEPVEPDELDDERDVPDHVDDSGSAAVAERRTDSDAPDAPDSPDALDSPDLEDSDSPADSDDGPAASGPDDGPAASEESADSEDDTPAASGDRDGPGSGPGTGGSSGTGESKV
ncbi:cell division protein PerM [Prauserella halophila]|nr:DUF6350 family protein [Prauserella halophila]